MLQNFLFAFWLSAGAGVGFISDVQLGTVMLLDFPFEIYRHMATWTDRKPLRVRKIWVGVEGVVMRARGPQIVAGKLVDVTLFGGRGGLWGGYQVATHGWALSVGLGPYFQIQPAISEVVFSLAPLVRFSAGDGKWENFFSVSTKLVPALVSRTLRPDPVRFFAEIVVNTNFSLSRTVIFGFFSRGGLWVRATPNPYVTAGAKIALVF